MQYAGSFSGSAPVIKRYKASATGLSAGCIVCSAPDGGSGQIIISAATATANQMGICLDTSDAFTGAPVTYSTTQAADEAVYGVIVNPDAFLRALMVTGATGTAITGDTVATAVSNGLTVVGGTSVASPDMDQGMIWFISGANAGKSRKIGSTSSVTATVLVPFPYASAVGDSFAYAGICPGLQGITLTTGIQNARVDIAVATGVNITALDMEMNGLTDSYVTSTYGDCLWTQTT